jgi:hypothetical protein
LHPLCARACLHVDRGLDPAADFEFTNIGVAIATVQWAFTAPTDSRLGATKPC